MITAGAIKINEEKVNSLEKTIDDNDFIEGKVLLLKKGKKNYYLITK